MPQTTHTPGPWAAEPPEKIMLGERWRVTAPTPKGKRRYTVAVLTDHSTDPADHATTEADARLIAAAPDLLAACVEMLDAADGPAGSHRRFRNAQGQALDAIRKATGQEDPAVGINADADAPDLLAALRNLLAVIDDSDQRSRPTTMRLLAITSGRPEFAAVDAARAAIRKATGQPA